MLLLKGYDASHLWSRCISRGFCSPLCSGSVEDDPSINPGPKTGSSLLNHSVILSSSQDIYTNLALEDWIYKNCDFSSRPWPLLLLWRNGPCVVIGRHQNPWTECKLLAMERHRVQLARRNSGGGTVYHDLGNLNCTFFTERSKYDRKKNLRLICDALRKRWSVDVSVSSREDILLENTFKISGTAAKLGRTTAYHHCTVLFKADTSRMSQVLKPGPTDGVESKATRSVGSPVKNLRDVIPSIDFEPLLEGIGDIFRQQYQLPQRQPLEIVTPSEEEFPGLTEIGEHLRSWDWLFGKCPRFTVEQRLQLWPPLIDNRVTIVIFKIIINRGLVEELNFEPDYWMKESSKVILTKLVGKRFPFRETVFEELTSDVNLCTYREDLEKAFLRETIVNCVMQLM